MERGDENYNFGEGKYMFVKTFNLTLNSFHTVYKRRKWKLQFYIPALLRISNPNKCQESTKNPHAHLREGALCCQTSKYKKT